MTGRGIPMRPIDADAVIDCVDADIAKVKTVIEGKAPYYVGAQMMYIAREVKESIKGYLDKASTLDYAPVKHASWVRQDDTYTRFQCGECKSKNFDRRWVFCPLCGAKMDGGKSDG